MYKYIAILFLFIIQGKINTSCAQINMEKKYQMGIIVGASLNNIKTISKIATPNNPGNDLTIGMNIIKSFNQNIAFNTGIEFDFSSMDYKYVEKIFYDYTDNQILSKKEKTNITNTNQFNLKERNQSPIYISIPTMLVFKTDYIGYNRFFSKFGMRHNFTLKDLVKDSDNNGNNNITMETNKELSIYTGSIGIAIGTEWNYLSNSTIMFELGYYYGITNLNRNNALFGDIDKNKTLYTTDINNNITYQTIKNTRDQIALKISFLF